MDIGDRFWTRASNGHGSIPDLNPFSYETHLRLPAYGQLPQKVVNSIFLLTPY
jgi:hypothetical protein